MNEYQENPMSTGVMVVVGLVAAGVAWFLLKPSSGGGSTCTPYNQLVAFSKALGYQLWYVEQQDVSTWKKPVTEFLATSKSRAYSSLNCSFYKWTGSTWVVDAGTNAELISYLAPAQLQGVYASL